MRNKILKGISIIATGVLFAKILSFISFYFVGAYLTPEQLGSYASVLGVVAILISVQSGSVGPLLVQKKVFSSNLVSEYLSYSIVINLIMLSSIVTIISILFFHDLNKLLIGLCMAINAFLSFGNIYYKAKLSTQESFKSITVLDTLMAIVQATFLITTVIFAKSEIAYGVSFLALACINIILITKHKYLTIPRVGPFLNVLGEARWLVKSSLLNHGLINAPYVVLGILEKSAVVGIFYFANQLISSIGILATKPIQAVILPVLNNSDLKGKQLANEFGRIVVIVGIALTIVSSIGAFLIAYLITFVWGAKWESAIPIAEMAVCAVAIKILTMFFWGYAESQALWKKKSMLHLLELLINLTACVVASYLSDNLLLISFVFFMTSGLTSIAIQVYISKNMGSIVKLYLLLETTAFIFLLNYFYFIAV